jgi:glucosamine-6-phosphate deaminase
METNLFDHVDIDKENTHVPDASASDLELAVKSYQEELNKAKIDVQILGIGGNGHIGFNEPGTPFDAGVHVVDLKEETIQANSRFFDGNINLVPKQAMTMGIKDIMRAKHIILLAFGKAKQDAVRSLVEGNEITENIPCTILKNHPSVYVLVDKEADFK